MKNKIYDTDRMKLIRVIFLNPFSVFLYLFLIGNLLIGAINFYDDMSNKDSSQWYEDSWIKNPVTKSIVYFSNNKTYWTKTDDNSEEWLVKETDIFGKSFWTLLKRQSASK